MAAQTLAGVAPPGWFHSVERMKRQGAADNPFALAWFLQKRGVRPTHTLDGADASFDAEVRVAADLASRKAIPDIFYAAGRGDLNAQYVLAQQGQLHLERR